MLQPAHTWLLWGTPTNNGYIYYARERQKLVAHCYREGFLTSVKNVLYNKDGMAYWIHFLETKKRDFADNFTLSLHVVFVHIRV